MTTLLERAARAMYDSDVASAREIYPDDSETEVLTELWTEREWAKVKPRYLRRTAVCAQAFREPTEAMVLAGDVVANKEYGVSNPFGAMGAFTAMIDAILAEKP